MFCDIAMIPVDLSFKLTKITTKFIQTQGENL